MVWPSISTMKLNALYGFLLARSAMGNLALSVESHELALSAGHWDALLAGPREGREWALHAKSVADRIGRVVQGFTDDLHRWLQPKAEYLGAAFEAVAWSVPVLTLGWSVLEGIGAALVLPALAALTARSFQGADRALAYGVLDTTPYLARAIDQVLSLDPVPDVTIVTGDLVDGAKPAEYARLKLQLARLPMPKPNCCAPASRRQRSRLRWT